MAYRGEFGQPGFRPFSGPRMQADGVGFGGSTPPREPGKPGQPGGDPIQLPGREPLRQLPAARGDGSSVVPPSQTGQPKETPEAAASAQVSQSRDTQQSEGSARQTLQEEIAGLEAQGYTPDEAAQLVSLSERLVTSPESRRAEEVLRRYRFGRDLVETGRVTENLREGESVQVAGFSIDEAMQSAGELWVARDAADAQNVAEQIKVRKAGRVAQPTQAEQLTVEDKRAAYQQWLADHGFPSDPMNQK
ncbi:MAG: hypothetical protein KGJ07_05280 [Patescibacteria group bacterium]|nr:hypothetical protein [Patescibacteria group bacterium]MDE2590938.1 hypothetical protein [Patescibacteria group bacterium]